MPIYWGGGIYLLVMPKYWGKQIFSLGSFPKVGQKQKTEKEREKERLNDGNNNGQLRIANATSGGARKAAWANFISRLVDLKQLWQIVMV